MWIIRIPEQQKVIQEPHSSLSLSRVLICPLNLKFALIQKSFTWLPFGVNWDPLVMHFFFKLFFLYSRFGAYKPANIRVR